MHDSDHHKYITFGWVATIIGLLLFGLLENSHLTREDQSSYYAEQCAQQHPNSPLGITYLDTKNGSIQEGENIDWCNLATAQSVAEDTASMRRAAWLGLSFTVFGAVLIGLTYAVTKDSNGIAERDTKLSHYPRFKITRCIIYAGNNVDNIPTFSPSESISGSAFAVNYGRYPATVDSSDIELVWAKGGNLPMSYAYNRMQKVNSFNQLQSTNGGPTQVIGPGDFRKWPDIHSSTPKDFKLSLSKGEISASHAIFIVGFIRYTGAAEDRRGYYFCKQYNFKCQMFEDAPIYETED
jgi:hypothetical protein